MKGAWLAAGLALTGVAVLGAALPVLPSTIFALGAAWCFARSNPRLERWLLEHPRFGPAIHAWRTQRAIATSAKVLALGSMAASGLIVALTSTGLVVAAAWLVLAASAAYVATRPTPAGDPAR